MLLMSTDHIELSSSPVMEECASVGQDDYAERSRKECKVYTAQLERMFPVPKELEGEVWFETKLFPHDLGSYREVCVVFNTENEKAIDYAYECEKNMPENWDEEALTQLAS